MRTSANLQLLATPASLKAAAMAAAMRILTSTSL